MVIEMTSANTPWIFLLSNKIQQNMTSLQLFFASLPLQHDNISHKHEQFNNQLTSTTQITDPMATTNLVYHPTKPCTLGAYLTWLCTPICFVPRCMLSWTDFRPTVTTYLLICQSAPTKITHGCHKHQQQFTIPTHLDIPCTHTINVAPQPTLENVSPNQLDHPPDHHHINHGMPTTIPIPDSTVLPTSAQTQTETLWQTKLPFANMGFNPMQQRLPLGPKPYL